MLWVSRAAQWSLWNAAHFGSVLATLDHFLGYWLSFTVMALEWKGPSELSSLFLQFHDVLLSVLQIGALSQMQLNHRIE